MIFASGKVTISMYDPRFVKFDKYISLLVFTRENQSTAKFFKIKVFKQKSDKSVYKMQFLVLQRIITLCFDLNNLNGIKKILVEFQSLKSEFQ